MKNYKLEMGISPYNTPLMTITASGVTEAKRKALQQITRWATGRFGLTSPDQIKLSSWSKYNNTWDLRVEVAEKFSGPFTLTLL